ncbi:XdhC family protein [Flagellimonas sp. S174]|uniref:XdhC family protein n=1 Tax=Flagellimonas sp. S174 TaxID=3410790 RepID=UPI003BF59B79
MTHELKSILIGYKAAKAEGIQSVLATVVALDGSSYRRPGVRMLLLENGKMIGAVSGGCVEKEVLRQAESVFQKGIPKVMVYDGRYRLGCEGILYILLEPFQPNAQFLEVFWETMKYRKPFLIKSFFQKDHSENRGYGSSFLFEGNELALNSTLVKSDMEVFEQKLSPCFQLIIIGAEHDAVQLCQLASLMGWEVTIVSNPREEKTANHFPGVHTFLQQEPENLEIPLDEETAVVLMTHSFVKDLGYLLALKDKNCAYLGLLGPMRRREKLFDELLERHPDIAEDFLDSIHGPAGIDIGAETPQEISISIISEILARVRQTEPMLLKEKLGKIHS